MAVVQTPLMRMGLIGFPDEAYLVDLLRTRSATMRWQRWNYLEADALWVNGERAQPARNHLVRVPSADPSRPAILLNLQEIDRPTAFTLPIGNGFLTQATTFDPRNAASVAEVLVMFEAALLPRAAQLWLAEEIVNRRHELGGTVYHLIRRGSLVAVIDITGDVGLLPTLTPAELAEAQWSQRPTGATSIPAHFQRVSFGELMWLYAMRTDADLLPPKYRVKTIHFRRAPEVGPRLMKDAHLALLGSLAATPMTFVQLQQQLGFSDTSLAQALAALYFTSSITTDATLAGVPLPARPSAEPDAHSAIGGSPASSGFEDPLGAPTVASLPAHVHQDTVPTPLGRK